MLTKNIHFIKFGTKGNLLRKRTFLRKLKNYYLNNKFFKSLSNKYIYSFNKSEIIKYKKFSNYNVIGIGGSSLGIEAIYKFLNFKIKKKFKFYNNIN